MDVNGKALGDRGRRWGRQADDRLYLFEQASEGGTEFLGFWMVNGDLHIWGKVQVQREGLRLPCSVVHWRNLGWVDLLAVRACAYVYLAYPLCLPSFLASSSSLIYTHLPLLTVYSLLLLDSTFLLLFNSLCVLLTLLHSFTSFLLVQLRAPHSQQPLNNSRPDDVPPKPLLLQQFQIPQRRPRVGEETRVFGSPPVGVEVGEVEGEFGGVGFGSGRGG